MTLDIKYLPNNRKVIKPRRMKYVEHVMRNTYNTLVGKTEGKKSLGRPRHRWEDTIRMYLREICLEIVDWIYIWLRRGTSWGLL
jgi:hypothetical protein